MARIKKGFRQSIRSESNTRKGADKRTSVRLDEGTVEAIARRIVKALQRGDDPSKRHYLDVYASDPIPEHAIGLSDAFAQVMNTAEKHPERLTLGDDEREEIRSSTESDLKRFVGENNYPPEDVGMIALGKQTNLFLRRCIKKGQLIAYVRDPETGEILQLLQDGWDDVEFYPGELGWLQSNHVHPDDPLNPGPPDVVVRGMARPVFFLRDQFELWLRKTFNDSNRPGRKRGSGSYAQDDEELVMRMHELMNKREVKSAEGAATKLAQYAKGDSKEISKRTRLAKRYRARFPSEGN